LERVLKLLPLERVTVADTIAESLRDEILGGSYPPGSAVTDGEVSARLNVPRDQARAALGRLEREGLLVHSLHRDHLGVRLLKQRDGRIRRAALHARG
jgi:DNA-binding GntR family transcriptional regulator